MRPHENLDVWKISIDFVVRVYNITSNFPKEECYGLVSQMRRSAVSISSNIAEGAARQTKTEFKQFLYIAKGSLSEFETQLIISLKLKYITSEEYKESIVFTNRIRKMLSGLIAGIVK